jgi:hypothetical protein
VSGKLPTFVEQLKYKARGRASRRRGACAGVWLRAQPPRRLRLSLTRAGARRA